MLNVKMKVLFVASEVNPILKVGGIADVIGSLTKEIRRAGHDARIALPFYQVLEKEKLVSLKKISSFEVRIDRKKEAVEIFQTFLPDADKRTGVPIYLIKNNYYLSDKGVYLDIQKFSSLARFLFFSKVVTEMFKMIDWIPDIVHCHDWHAGIVPLLLRIKNGDIDKAAESRLPVLPAGKQADKIKTFFTIHNLLIQGCWNYSRVLDFLELKGNETPSLLEKSPGPYGNNFNVVQQAILNSDLISVVSPTYAREIKTKTYYARGLKEVIQKRKEDIYGIVNGIDTELFKPETDKFIRKNYSVNSLDLKVINKIGLQEETGLAKDPEVPLLAMISRLDVQKGIDLVCQAVNQIVGLGGQIIFLGKGERKYETMLEDIAGKHPGQVVACIKFDSKLAQRIYAGADIFLMPSRFEPCGLSQLIAMRYGTIPIVRKTGGLSDTVEKFGFKNKVRGTGFVFEKYSLSEFMKSVERAVSIYYQKNVWQRLQKNAMKKDFSWKKSAQKYLDLYKKLLKK